MLCNYKKQCLSFYVFFLLFFFAPGLSEKALPKKTDADQPASAPRSEKGESNRRTSSHAKPASSPAPAPAPESSKPKPKKNPSSPAAKNGTLDPAQEKALRALGITLGPDPCNTEVQTLLICDSSKPRRVLALEIQYCEQNFTLPISALSALGTTLRTLTFTDCPAKISQLPRNLANSLQTLTLTRSLGRTPQHPELPPLRHDFLMNLHNLTSLTVEDVFLNVTFQRIIEVMPKLQTLTLTNTNVTGELPARLPSTLTSLRLKENKLKSVIPKSISDLSMLTYLDLSSNRFTGPIPKSLTKLELLTYLDLSNNTLNGSIPSNISSIKSLRYVDLSNNNLSGVLPFTTAFVRHLNTFRMGSNSRLCYNATVLLSAISGGANQCDRHGNPMEQAAAPSPDDGFAPSPEPSAYDDDVAEVHHHRKGPKTVVVAVAVALASLVLVIIIAVLFSRCCSGNR